MHCKRTLFGLMLVVMTGLGADWVHRTILVDDFGDGVADGWSETDFTGGRGSFDASSGSYVLETTEPIPVDDPSVGTLDADWEPSEEDTTFANGTVSGTIRADTDGTTVGFLLRDSHETESDYGFFGSAGFGTFYIEHFNFSANPGAPQTILAMADPEGFPFEVGVTYNLEASAVGSKLTLRAWKVGDERPATPILCVFDRRLPPSTGSGIAAIAFFDPVPLMDAGVTEVEISATVDDITFTQGLVR